MKKNSCSIPSGQRHIILQTNMNLRDFYQLTEKLIADQYVQWPEL
jgi:hypothetical protein